MKEKIKELFKEYYNDETMPVVELEEKVLALFDVVGRSEQLNKRPNTSSTLECFTKSEKQQKFTIMELTLNELKIIRNALNAKLRTVHLKSSEFDDIKQTLYKINFEIERIEYDAKQKDCDEAFRAISDILKPRKINHSFINLEVVLDKIQEAAFNLEANGAKPEKIIILAPKYFIEMLHDEFKKMTGDKINRRDRMKLYGYPIFPSFENKITVYDEDIVGDLKRLPIKIELY